jgi:hypothetical protein
MANANGTTGGSYPIYQYQTGQHQTGPVAAPQYVWREGYSHGGMWQGGWVLVQ